MFDAAEADDGFVACGAAPGGLFAFFEAHGAGPGGGGFTGSVDGERGVGEGEAVGADEAALVAFDHGAVVGPGGGAEITFKKGGAFGVGVVHGWRVASAG